jgi:predicted XRE-type DNA-binding protein
MKNKATYYSANKFTNFADWLAVNIAAAHMIQSEFASLMGVSQGYISACTTGRYTPVNLGTVTNFAKAFGHDEDSYDLWDICW